MKILLGIFIGVLAVVVVLVLVAGYFGLVPGVASIFGSDKPRDLGVTYTQDDYQSAREKGNIQRISLPEDTPPEESLEFSGQQDASFNLTEEEATALLNIKSWRYFPLHDCQARFNPNGTGEFSGVLEMDTLKDYALARGYAEDDLKVVTDWVSRFAVLQKDMPFYMKGTASVHNGVINFNVQQLQFGRISIPASQINDHKAELIDLLEEGFSHIDGFSINEFSLSNGQIYFDGTLPTSVARATGNR